MLVVIHEFVSNIGHNWLIPLNMKWIGIPDVTQLPRLPANDGSYDLILFKHQFCWLKDADIR